MTAETEILTSVFAAASGLPGSPGWPHVLALLAEETRAGTARLDFDRQGRGTRWQSGTGDDLPLDREEAPRMRSYRVYGQGDLPGLWDRTMPVRAIRCPVGPGAAVTLLLRRQGEDFRATAGARLSSLAPYLGPALRTWDALEHERRQAAYCREIAHDLGAGWIRFSPGSVVLDLSPDLPALLEAQGGLRIASDGRISFRDAAMAQALRQALSDATPGAPVLLCIAENPRLELLISADHKDGERRLLGRLRHARRARSLPLATICRHLGLPPAEARLAACLCDGQTLSEAACDLGWTIETARSTSKQIFARLGVRNQQDVVRRMQASAMWFAEAR